MFPSNSRDEKVTESVVIESVVVVTEVTGMISKELFALEVLVVTDVIVVASVLVIGKATEPKAVPMMSMMTPTPTNDRKVEPFIYLDDLLEGILYVSSLQNISLRSSKRFGLNLRIFPFCYLVARRR